jgi:hypothetical protein
MNLEQADRCWRFEGTRNLAAKIALATEFYGKGVAIDKYRTYMGKTPVVVEVSVYLHLDLDLEGALQVWGAVSETEFDPAHPSLDKFVGRVRPS